MELTVLIPLILLIVSEILPYTPLKGNGVVQQILAAAREIFPHKSSIK